MEQNPSSVAGTIINFDIKGTAKKKRIRLTGSVDSQFSTEGKWMRGSLHCHIDRPTNPDWTLAALEHYYRAGFDFIAGMDHDRIVEVKHSDSLLVVPGMEISGPCHFLAFDIAEPPEPGTTGDRIAKTAAIIEKINSGGGITILAHPFKSGYTWRDLQVLCSAGLLGFEVVNSNVRGKKADAGRSDQLWHGLLREGWYLRAIGGDDAHSFPEDIKETGWPSPSQAAWTGVLVKERTPEGIFNAIRSGRTYASEGPEIRGVKFFKDGRLKVECSPCVACHLRSVGGFWGGASVYPPAGAGAAEEFVFHFSEEGYRIQDYIVIVLQDDSGRRAWASPIPVKINATAL